MKTKKYALYAGLSLSLLLTACASGEESNEDSSSENQTEETKQEESKDEKQSFDVAQSTVGKQVAAYQELMDELGKMKEDQEVDWELVSTTYKDDMQSSVTEVNGDFDQAISSAITAAQNDELEQNAARQIIDKGLQSYFYQKQKGIHGDIVTALEDENTTEADEQFQQLNYLAEEVFIPTAEKRDSYYELSGDSSIVQNINAGLSAQEEALNNGNADDFAVYKQVTDKSIYRSYYLAAQSYAEKIEQAASENAEEAELQAEQAEAWGFLQAIQGSLSGGDEEAATKLNTLFTLNETDPATIQSDEVKDLFVQAFVGKIKSYHEKAPKSVEEGNLTDARGAALEANVFMKAIEMAMQERLGEEESSNLLDKAETWYEAIENENLEEANALSEEIVSSLDQLVK
ncbi:hypothetical protein N781_10280 [Pontibacillus halophilus JSM 076056 = DSM 19796]|uniref:Lipoprotein n=1 Tax=Pontibacillus halophilus JSM 076056 = DSM 19796 TaxID=1385510 RepID=A0A0A5GJK5_9BACI|nr:hypothetical protein [Pontibacillus halophilus]KGX93431.1 hypothetical protein N781_10280 [Pontibacillus halophilus JSM 076056 = DSM 19796]